MLQVAAKEGYIHLHAILYQLALNRSNLVLAVNQYAYLEKIFTSKTCLTCLID